MRKENHFSIQISPWILWRHLLSRLYIYLYTQLLHGLVILYVFEPQMVLFLFSFFLMVIKSSSWKLGLCSHSDSQRFLKYKVPGCATKFGLEIKWFPRCSDVNILQIINTKQDNQVYVPCMFIFFFFILKRFVIRWCVIRILSTCHKQTNAYLLFRGIYVLDAL